MKRNYQGKTVDITIYPSGKDQGETGMYVEMDKQGWKKTLFISDATTARIIGREMYYALVCEFFPDDFQTKPSPSGVVFRRIRKKSSSTRIRMTPQEAGVEADPYDKDIIDTVEQSSQLADLGEAKLRVEKTVFQSIQGDGVVESADKMWWDIKFRLTLLVICWKYGLLKNSHTEEIHTIGELFQFWRTRGGMNEREMYFERDQTLTPLGQAIMDSTEQTKILTRLFRDSKAIFWLHDELVTLQTTNHLPEIDGHMMMSVEQSRFLQIVLVIILFGVLVVGIGSFITENKKIMRMLEQLKKE